MSNEKPTNPINMNLLKDFNEQIKPILPKAYTVEQIEKIKNRFMNRPKEYETMTERQKMDYNFHQLEEQMIGDFPPIEETRKEVEKHIHIVEADGTTKGHDAPRLNIKAHNSKLIMTNENGKVINFDNIEVLEEYRLAKNRQEYIEKYGKDPLEEINKEKAVKQEDITKKIIENREWE
jgi:hypothetical protein